jgi:mannobiose 2-epimerase
MMFPAQAADINEKLLHYKKETEAELSNMLEWWSQNMIDDINSGFYGSVNNENVPDTAAAKGIVLNSRILWTFSAAYSFTKRKSHLVIAERAFRYIINHFVDHEYGGVYWSVEAAGKMLEGKKQIYGLAFCLYGLSEFYKINRNGLALQLAKELFSTIEQYSYDRIKGGYIEAFSREWNETESLRLSDKDGNERKTMNTHLHIIEAYANLYTIWPDKLLKEKIGRLLEVFDRHFINKENNHLHLFMNDDWEPQSTLISYGHDIEAAWLLQECAEIAGYKLYEDRFKELAIKLADAAAEGLDDDGGLWYEYEPAKDKLVREKHSWPQAEAMIGFYNAYQLTGNTKYMDHSYSSWNFIKKNILDKENGEWFWGVYEDGSVMPKEKAGFWKCPYHSGRACLEIIKRINSQLK